MTVLTLVLLVLGPALLVAEAHLPTYGALGTAGAGAIATALALAILDSGASLAVALVLVLGIVVLFGVGGFVATRKALAASRRRPRGGGEGLIGHVGVVRRPLDPVGHVMVEGELWRARRSWADEDEPPPAKGEPVVVDRVQGLTLSVRRAETWEVEL